MSRTLSTKSGSVESLKVSSCHGFSPKAFHIRLTVGCDIPNDFASPLVDQCVASAGFSVKVFTITASTWSSVTVRGTPERCSSARPFSRLATNRERHLPTVVPVQPSSAATAWFVLPSAQPSTILDRKRQALGAGRPARPSGQGVAFFVTQHQDSFRSTSSGHTHLHRRMARTRRQPG